MLANTLVYNTIWTLRRAFKNSKAPIWKSLENELSGPRSNRREVNVGELANITRNNEVVMVPAKVLGAGAIGHRLTVCTFSISETAAKKIIDSGGKIITLDYLIENYPDGKGVRIIG
ncbi:MAG: 50S ribosomal protein L18e [Nitrososphaeraceae archaeon]